MSKANCIQSFLTSAVEEGEKMAKSFIDGALSDGQSRSFYDMISQSKIKTFEDMTKKTKLKCRSRETLNVHHINPELVFRRALVLANSRDDVTVEKVLFYSNCTFL